LILLDETSRPKEIEYPQMLYTNITDILSKEVFRTLNMDYRRVIVGCLSGTIAVLGFDEQL